LRDKEDIYDFMHFFNHGNVKAQRKSEGAIRMAAVKERK
jgi:hypothetical protein